jgi:DNA primase
LTVDILQPGLRIKMNLLSLCMADTELKKVATTRGGEYAGPCPFCGNAEDNFRVWPNDDKGGHYWCRYCMKKPQDTIQYLRDKRGMSFPEARNLVEGKALANTTRGPGPSTGARSAATPTPGPELWTPQNLSLPGELWQAQAVKLVDYAAGKLLQSVESLSYLYGRGLNDETITAAKLGLIPPGKEEKYVKREAWGLEKELQDNGKEKDLWIPAGIVIPYFLNDQVARLRIRRHEGKPRYYILKGSCMGPMVLGPERDVFIIVESELDALLLWQDCSDLAGAVALGSITTRPDTGAAAMLRKAQLILVALDADQAGAKESWQWWLKTFDQAKRWSSVGGKDPGEMWQNQEDIRAWVEAGIKRISLNK